jgi:hypothetical protein
MKVIKEHFNSIDEFMKVIESRPNNSAMAGKYSSMETGSHFYGTETFEEAKELLKFGYKDILPKVKSGVAENLKRTETRQRRHIENGVVGYAPNVPNAIMGLPNSMINVKSVPQKVKAISLVVGITENCGTETEEFIKSGIAALGVVNSLELQGYRVSLKVACKVSRMESERVFCTVTLKNYRDHLDLQKLCFPLAHPSMFRRFGFKWMETVPGLTNSGWAFGYGQSYHNYEEFKKLFLSENEYFIDLKTTRDCKYDPEAIIKHLNIVM